MQIKACRIGPGSTNQFPLTGCPAATLRRIQSTNNRSGMPWALSPTTKGLRSLVYIIPTTHRENASSFSPLEPCSLHSDRVPLHGRGGFLCIHTAYAYTQTRARADTYARENRYVHTFFFQFCFHPKAFFFFYHTNKSALLAKMCASCSAQMC